MSDQMLHIFRNTPMGRENLMQAAYFCQRQFGLSLAVMIPSSTEFALGLGDTSVTIDLDDSYMTDPDSARRHVEEVLQGYKAGHSFYSPQEVAGSSVPLVSGDWAALSCPRAISEKSGRIGLGHIGPKVRGIVKDVSFPVFLPATCFKVWNSVAIFFGGSELGTLVVKQGLALARLSRVPFHIYTQLDGVSREECEQALDEAGVLEDARAGDGQWHFFEEGTLETNLYAVPHDALVVVGVAGRRLIAELLFGSTFEIIQATVMNPMVLVGPKCRTQWQLPG